MLLNANPTTITTSGGSSTITAVIAAGSHTISSVDLYTGSTKVGEMTLSSGDYVYTVTPSETTTYTVKINYGESETVSPSTSVTVTVNLTLPTLTSLTASPTTISSGGSSTISAVVNAGSYTISKVDLYTGTTKVGEMTFSPGSYNYSVSPSDTSVYKVRIYYGETNPIIPDDTVTVTVEASADPYIDDVSSTTPVLQPMDGNTVLFTGYNIPSSSVNAYVRQYYISQSNGSQLAGYNNTGLTTEDEPRQYSCMVTTSDYYAWNSSFKNMNVLVPYIVYDNRYVVYSDELLLVPESGFDPQGSLSNITITKQSETNYSKVFNIKLDSVLSGYADNIYIHAITNDLDDPLNMNGTTYGMDGIEAHIEIQADKLINGKVFCLFTYVENGNARKYSILIPIEYDNY